MLSETMIVDVSRDWVLACDAAGADIPINSMSAAPVSWLWERIQSPTSTESAPAPELA